jgi:hypothetical protein
MPVAKLFVPKLQRLVSRGDVDGGKDHGQGAVEDVKYGAKAAPLLLLARRALVSEGLFAR